MNTAIKPMFFNRAAKWISLAIFCWLNCVWASETEGFVRLQENAGDVADSDSKGIVVDGNFEQWNDELPVAWSVDIGATDGAQSPLSELAKSESGGIRISGDRTTKAWRFVSQELDLNPGDMIEFQFEARAKGVKREGFQKDNCFVGFVPTDVKNNRLSPRFLKIESTKFSGFREAVRCPEEMTKAEIWIFLSKTGTLEVKNIRVRKLKPEDSFDVLVADMKQHYSFFELKEIDWPALSANHRDEAMAAKTTADFSRAITKMLAELQDIHVWLINEKRRMGSYEMPFESNSEFNVLAKKIKSPTPFRGLGVVGETEDKFIYLNLRTLRLPYPILSRVPVTKDFKPSREPLDRILNSISQRIDAPGMIVDLRLNSGGSEDMAKEIVGLMTDEEAFYAKSRYRQGDGPGSFGKDMLRSFQPTGDRNFKGPIVCLIGPGTVSSAEGMALMMKALPNCTLMGQPTRGSSGNPKSILLPNGVEVFYSRWQSLQLDGTCIEGVGINPDIEVDHVPGSDVTFEKAIEFLREKNKSAK